MVGRMDRLMGGWMGGWLVASEWVGGMDGRTDRPTPMLLIVCTGHATRCHFNSVTYSAWTR